MIHFILNEDVEIKLRSDLQSDTLSAWFRCHDCFAVSIADLSQVVLFLLRLCLAFSWVCHHSLVSNVFFLSVQSIMELMCPPFLYCHVILM
jgi:hypothetical protein